MDSLYDQLCRPFDTTYTLRKGEVDLSYLTLEQVVSRLNEVLGVDGWWFDVKEHGSNEAHCWALGSLGVYFPTRSVIREQMGECSMSRGMAIGDARKGAVSDALKKCASLFGVGLYLQAKEEPAQPSPAPMSREEFARTYEEVWQDAPKPALPACSDCKATIEEWRRKDGTIWSALQVAEYARKKYGRVLCWSCGRKAAG